MTQSQCMEAPPPLVPGRALLEAARAAKSTFSRYLVATNEEERSVLAAEVNRRLATVRPELFDLVRKLHPGLEVVDEALNLGRVDLDGYRLSGTAEALIDVEATHPTVARLSEVLAIGSGGLGQTELTAVGGLAGSGSQPRVVPFPADVDLDEVIRVVGPSPRQAAELVVQRVQAVQRRAEAPASGPPVMSLGLNVGVYPPTHPRFGERIYWSPWDVERGYVQWIGAGGAERYSLAEAVSNPGPKVPNSYWRGFVDAAGTWGEVTKVMTYVAEGADRRWFGSALVGQDYQAVAFGSPPFLDELRVGLASGLFPQIQYYLDEGLPLKANKRAYTVARCLNDVESLNALAPLLSGRHAHVCQVLEQVAMFVDEIVAADGVASIWVSASQTRKEAVLLARRIALFDAKLSAEFESAIATQARVRANPALAAILDARVLGPLTALTHDAAYTAQTRVVLGASGYLLAVQTSRLVRADVNDSSFLDADLAWSNGRLARAAELYGERAALDPGDWAARFQMLWIRHSLETVPLEERRGLQRTGLTVQQQTRVTLLASREGAELARWTEPASGLGGWQQAGRLAAAGFQPGLAATCFHKHSNLIPGLRMKDSEEHRARFVAARHLAEINGR